MKRQHPHARAGPSKAPGDRHTRKHRVLSQGLPSITRSIANAVVLKQGDLFLIAEPDGQLPATSTHGLGLYYHDCRYLCTYELRLNGTAPVSLGVTAAAGDHGIVQLTNPELDDPAYGALPRDTLDIEWSRSLDGDGPALSDVLTLRNWGHQPVELELELRFDARFEDVFQIRGLLHERLGKAESPAWDQGMLRFVYHGVDHLSRSVTVFLPRDLERRDTTTAGATIRLEARQERRLAIRVLLQESGADGAVREPEGPAASPRARPDATTCTSNSGLLDAILARAFADLHLLRSTLRGRTFLAAGIPWFATLFGRDSLVAALQLLPFSPSVARDTLHLLAELQADQTDEWRDAAPGKILHELRVGEMARAGVIPHEPYYGTVDATPLFLIVLGRYVDWTGDLTLFDELHDHVRRALEWIDRYGDGDGDGYIEYQSASEHGLINQGWKDSGDAIVDEQGRIATPPIALVEVQAYVYAAKRGVAELYRRRNDQATAERLRSEAAELRTRFDDDFWVESLDCYAMALEANKQPLRVVSSNAGHALWSGIAAPERAARVADRLMADDMFSGWGIRTLSTIAQGYNPIGYHLGTVWPHDNAIIAAGLKRYGFDGQAARIFDGIAAAASEFEHRRLPELWTGFARDRYDTPIRYPVACHPQAWAAGALPFLLTHLLGLEPSGLDRRLAVVRPTLPGAAEWLEVRGLQVGDATMDLHFERTRDGEPAHMDVVRLEGKLDIELEDTREGGRALTRRAG
jgi:glycogen debranching enzyme